MLRLLVDGSMELKAVREGVMQSPALTLTLALTLTPNVKVSRRGL